MLEMHTWFYLEWSLLKQDLQTVTDLVDIHHHYPKN